MAKFSASKYKEYMERVYKKNLETILKESVEPAARQAMRDTIIKDIYNSYSPTVYERRGDDDGLKDSNNIVSEHNGLRLRVKNIAKPNKSLLGTELYSEPRGLLYRWIDNGEIPNITPYSSYRWRMNRNGITNRIAVNFIHSGQLRDIIKKSLKRRNLIN